MAYISHLYLTENLISFIVPIYTANKWTNQASSGEKEFQIVVSDFILPNLVRVTIIFVNINK